MTWDTALMVAPFLLVVGILCFHIGGLRAQLDHVLEYGHRSASAVATVEVVVERTSNWFHFFGRRIMLQGDVLNFRVVCKNARGIVVAASDVTATVTPTGLAAATVAADGSNGTLTAAVDQNGPGTLTATAGGVTSAPFSFTVDVDNKIASVEVQVG